MVKKELSNLIRLGKMVLPRKIRKKIRGIRDLREQIDLHKHAIKSWLEMEIHEIETLTKEKEKNNDVFNFVTKANLLNLKIKYFNISHEKGDLKKIVKEIKEVKRELGRLS